MKTIVPRQSFPSFLYSNNISQCATSKQRLIELLRILVQYQ